MDLLVQQGTGGYQTRTDLIVDSVRQNVELLLAEGQPEEAASPALLATPSAPPEKHERPRLAMVERELNAVSYAELLRGSEIRVTNRSRLVEDAEQISRVEPRPLFGMHNRDYPSLWAACQLAAATQDDLVELDQFLDQLTDAAWGHGRYLAEIQALGSQKTTALFPTNIAKRKSAGMAFRQYAVGRTMPDPSDNGRLLADGPLFQWHMAALAGNPRRPLLGLTYPGWQLLAGLEGLTVEEPHPDHATRHFLAYLSDFAPVDFKVLGHVLSAVGPQGATRAELLRALGERWPDWSVNEVSTNAAGYIGRAREWGLLQAKQQAGRYQLSGLGREYVLSHKTRKEGEL
jgi:hypothetical protein